MSSSIQYAGLSFVCIGPSKLVFSHNGLVLFELTCWRNQAIRCRNNESYTFRIKYLECIDELLHLLQ